MSDENFVQRVNLLDALPKPVTDYVSSQRIVQVCAGFVCLLMLIFIVGVWHQVSGVRQLAKLKTQQQQAQQEFITTQKKYPNLAKRVPYEQQIENLNSQVKEHSVLLSILSGGNNINTKGFSAYFSALAKNIISGVWLTNINIQNGGQSVTLTGKAIRSDLVADFLTRLTADEPFKKHGLVLYRIFRSKDDAKNVTFILKTPGVESDDEK